MPDRMRTEDDATIREVLLDRHVPFVNEVAEFIRESGGKTLGPILDSLKSLRFPDWMGKQESDAARQRAIRTAILGYRQRVEAPAAELLRRRKPPSRVHRVALGGELAVLEALEPDLSGLARSPRPSSLALRVSSASLVRDAAHKFAGGAHCDVLVLYFSQYRPLSPSPEGYTAIPDPLHGRGRPQEHRAMSSPSCHQVDDNPGHVIWFASLDGYRQGCDGSELVLTRWALRAFEPGATWHGPRSRRIRDLLEDDATVFNLCRGATVVDCTVLSVVQSDVVYLNVRTKDAALALTVDGGRVVSVSQNDPQSKPAASSMFATSFVMFMDKVNQNFTAIGNNDNVST